MYVCPQVCAGGEHESRKCGHGHSLSDFYFTQSQNSSLNSLCLSVLTCRMGVTGQERIKSVNAPSELSPETGSKHGEDHETSGVSLALSSTVIIKVNSPMGAMAKRKYPRKEERCYLGS